LGDPVTARVTSKDGATLKVLVAAYQVSPFQGSEPSFGWHTSVELAALGIDVHVITGASSRKEIEARGTTGSGLCFHYIEPSSRPIGFRSGHRGVYADYLLWQRGCLATARALDAEHHFDAVHHLSWGSLFWGSPLSRLDKPFVFGPVGGGQTSPRELREWFDKSWDHEARRNWALRWALSVNPRARRTARAADVVLATNSETARRAQIVGARRVELCLDGGLTQDEVPSGDRTIPDLAAPTVLWVGRNLPPKGVRLALEAFARAKRTLPEAQLVMLGSGLDDECTTAQIDELGVVGSVHRLGFVSLSEVADWYDRSSILLFSSLRETFGVQVLEAMAHGLPIVALDLHGVSDFVPADAGAKVPVGHGLDLAEALSDGIVRLVTDEAQWLSASKSAQRTAAQHTWRQRAQHLAAHYTRLAKSTGSSAAPSS
jgi:glycosyltransferase involved in cell wall biosynthesis